MCIRDSLSVDAALALGKIEGAPVLGHGALNFQGIAWQHRMLELCVFYAGEIRQFIKLSGKVTTRSQ